MTHFHTTLANRLSPSFVSADFLFLGDELECIQPGLYRNVARQLNISVAMENVVSDAFLGVATEIFSAGTAKEMRSPWKCWGS